MAMLDSGQLNELIVPMMK